MKILVINSGSSSLKFQLIQTSKPYKIISKGIVDGLGLKSCKFTFTPDNKTIKKSNKVKNHHEALKLVFSTLKDTGIIEKYTDINAIGHRVVHGGEKYTAPTRVNSKILKELQKLSSLAPLHNPANIEGIKGCKKILPNTPQIAVFDTAFHQSMPEKAYLYGLPYEYYKNHNIRRYGFHGTSHKYVINKALKLLKKRKAKIISCHLGNGSSITAFDGKVLDTSMGFTPLEGVLMGTRSGSIDPSIIFHLSQKLKIDLQKIKELLNEKSGLLGVSKISSDMRLIYASSKKNNKYAKLSIELLAYQIAKYIGAYCATLNGVEGIVFTGGIGENAFYLREKVVNYLGFINAKLDKKKNIESQEVISSKNSKVKIFAIKTNEEFQIAKETENIL